MGFNYRKSFKLAPGVRMTVSKSGIGYSVGGKGVRVTKRARGGVQTTVHVPGTGLSYTTSSSTSASTRKRSKPLPADAASKKAQRRDKAAVTSQPLNGGPAIIAAPVPTAGKPRWSWRRTNSNTPHTEGQAGMPQPTPQENRAPLASREVGQSYVVQPDFAPPRSSRNFRVAGLWYYVVLIGTAGVFAWVPFLHAAIKLKTVRARWLALTFGGLDVLMFVLLAVTPQDSQGHVIAGPISTVGGLLAIGTIILGCIMMAPLRRKVFEGVRTEAGDAQAIADPAIKAALAARARREEARKLAAEDPLLARELRIGRPDIAREYDDGGLVDVNSAPAHVIAEVCGIPADAAAKIVNERDRQGGQFSNVDEIFIMTDMPVSQWDRVRDRAIALG